MGDLIAVQDNNLWPPAKIAPLAVVPNHDSSLPPDGVTTKTETADRTSLSFAANRPFTTFGMIPSRYSSTPSQCSFHHTGGCAVSYSESQPLTLVLYSA